MEGDSTGGSPQVCVYACVYVYWGGGGGMCLQRLLSR